MFRLDQTAPWWARQWLTLTCALSTWVWVRHLACLPCCRGQLQTLGGSAFLRHKVQENRMKYFFELNIGNLKINSFLTLIWSAVFYCLSAVCYCVFVDVQCVWGWWWGEDGHVWLDNRSIVCAYRVWLVFSHKPPSSKQRSDAIACAPTCSTYSNTPVSKNTKKKFLPNYCKCNYDPSWPSVCHNFLM